MSKTYVSPSGTANTLQKVYFGDSNNLAKSVDKIYIGDQNGIARMVFGQITPPIPTLPIYLFQNGISTNEEITGGWTTEAKGFNNSFGYYEILEKPTIRFDSTEIATVVYTGKYTSGVYGKAGIYVTNNNIDLTPYNTLSINSKRNGYRSYFLIIDPSNNSVAKFYTITTLKTYILDISTLSGNYKLAYYNLSSKDYNTNTYIYNLYFSS